MSWDFTTKNVHVYLNGKGAGLGDIDSVDDITLKWSAEIELREWGIKGLYISVPDQKVTLSGQHYAENNWDKDPVDFEIEIELKNIDYGNFDAATLLANGNDVYPETIEIEYDEKSKTWTGSIS